MLENQDYAELALEDLLTEEKKIKRKEILSALITGFLIGVIIYGVVKKGIGFLHIAIPLALIYGNYKNSEKNKNRLKQIRTAIAAKTAK